VITAAAAVRIATAETDLPGASLREEFIDAVSWLKHSSGGAGESRVMLQRTLEGVLIFFDEF
jgi:hypothetical protein